MSVQEIAALDQPAKYKKRKTVMDEYMNIIYKMLRDALPPENIFAYVIKSGYSGNLKTLENYIELFSENNFSRSYSVMWAWKKEYAEDVTIVKRKELLRYITTRNEKTKKNEAVEQNLECIEKKYPVVKELKTIYTEFYSALMGNDPNKIDDFIAVNKDSCCQGFVEGIKRDITPVKNAISLPVSSGFVEGNNNKFKLIKRILYGRAKLVNLFRKCYPTFRLHLPGFSLQKLIK